MLELTVIKLHEHQINAIKKSLEVKNSLWCIRTGGGKCHGKGTKILMHDGSIKNVEDIVVGDQLMGDDSTPRNVLSLARGRDQMYKVIPNRGGEPFTCNSEHILSLKERFGPNDSQVRITNIAIKDYLERSNRFKRNALLYKPQTPTTFKTSCNLDYDPYLLGLWIADGRKNCMSFSVNNNDTEIIEYLYKQEDVLKCKITCGNIQKNSKDISLIFKKNNNRLWIYFIWIYRYSSSIYSKWL